MAYTRIVFEHPRSGRVREAPVGFSWTVLFFGFFPPLFRSDWKWAILILGIALLTGGLSILVFMFIYNKLYVKDLIGAGYKAKSVADGTLDEVAEKLGLDLPRLRVTTGG